VKRRGKKGGKRERECRCRTERPIDEGEKRKKRGGEGKRERKKKRRGGKREIVHDHNPPQTRRPEKKKKERRRERRLKSRTCSRRLWGDRGPFTEKKKRKEKGKEGEEEECKAIVKYYFMIFDISNQEKEGKRGKKERRLAPTA